ncbi:hypothetical protein F7C95_15525 [Opitutia bacterium ISCC 51]|nr:hypothetical protein F7C95_15525 [Opitutae bacterium ISCC 51]QXD27395.1 hypothetical protein GA003_15425 [Opitutae bacterium ISCC 52]
MKIKIVFSMVVAILLGACASLQTQVDPVLGEWQYVIENLPQGEPEGIFTIVKEGDGYSGTLQRKGDQAVPLVDIIMGSGVLESSGFNTRGYSVVMSGTFEGASFTGTLSTIGRTFPISAEKK